MSKRSLAGKGGGLSMLLELFWMIPTAEPGWLSCGEVTVFNLWAIWSFIQTHLCPQQRIKQFLLLSKQRTVLITQCLKDSETSKPSFMPRLYINRRLAMEHRDNPAVDPGCKNTVFAQVWLASALITYLWGE